jgi:uncharacterized protein DUF4382
MKQSRILGSIVVVTAVLATMVLVACGGGGGSTSNSMNTAPAPGFMNTFMSDPPTCAAPSGPYSHVYVTVTDVRINMSSSADPNSTSGWIDLAPNLASAPKQIDLLGKANTSCFLAQLGANIQLPAGTYEQLRIILAPNNGSVTGVTNNACGSNSVFNCVQLAGDNSIHTLLLNSEAITGIKVPPGVNGGGLTVPPGGTVDVDIDFDACASIVAEAGKYRLKPTLHSGEVSVNTTSLTGQVVDSITMNPISGGTTIVALEQKDASGVDRVIMQTLADSTGNFSFCPVPTGTFDVVAVAVDGQGVAYAATITSGVMQGTAMGKIPLIAETGASTAPGSITGTVTSATSVPAGTAADVVLSATQPAMIGGSNVLVTIPLVAQSASTALVSTASDVSCPVNTDCVTYTLSVPAANPNVGAFNSGGTTYTQDTVDPIAYTVDGQAFVPLSAATPDCSPSDVQVNTLKGGGNLVVTAGGSATAADMVFTMCQ